MNLSGTTSYISNTQCFSILLQHFAISQYWCPHLPTAWVFNRCRTAAWSVQGCAETCMHGTSALSFLWWCSCRVCACCVACCFWPKACCICTPGPSGNALTLGEWPLTFAPWWFDPWRLLLGGLNFTCQPQPWEALLSFVCLMCPCLSFFLSHFSWIADLEIKLIHQK